MTSIGCRCRGGDVHSRAVLIARLHCARGACLGGVVASFPPVSLVLFRCSLRQDPRSNPYPGGLSPGVPPLPIPNREVKPGRADGTAPQCGRVGRRLLEGVPPHHDDEGGLFVILVYVYVNRYCGGSGVSLELGGIFYEKRKGA